MISWFDDAQDEDDEFIEAAKAIRLLALDVDGVLTDGTIYIAADGECLMALTQRMAWASAVLCAMVLM